MSLEIAAGSAPKVTDGRSRHGGMKAADIAKFADAGAPRQFIDTESLNDTIRKRAITARNLNRLDQKDAARKLGYRNSSALSKIESGMAKIPKDFIIKASLAYGVSSDYLLGLSSEPERDPKVAEHMAIIRTVDAQIREQNHALASILLKNASDMTPMEGHLYALIAPTRRAIDAFETVCRKNPKFQNDVLAGSTLQRAVDELQIAVLNAKSFMDKRSSVVQARTEAMCEGHSYPLFEDQDQESGAKPQ